MSDPPERPASGDQSEPMPTGYPPTAGRRVSGHSPATDGARVLLVDDNAMHQMLTAALLKERGYAVSFAADGLEAIEAFEASEFDFILLDLQMPRMDGFEAARRIRELEAGRIRRVPIIAITSLTTAEDRERCLEAGMDEHVTKPIDPSTLDAAIAARFLQEPADFELARALERASGNEDLLESVLEAFLGETPARLQVIHRALDTGDAETLGQTAHTIEGRAHELAMPRLRDVAHRIAVLSGQGDFAGAAALTSELEAAFGRGTSAVRQAFESA